MQSYNESKLQNFEDRVLDCLNWTGEDRLSEKNITGNRPGDWLSISCVPGYQLPDTNKSMTSVCKPDGFWSHEIEKCERR